MQLLLLTPQLPYPPHQGTAIRNWGLIRHLAQRGHAITLLTFAESQALTPAPELCAACANIHITPLPAPRSLLRRLQTLFTPQADLAERLWSEPFRIALTEVLQTTQFDVIQIEGLELASYITTLRQYQPQTPLVYDAHNAEYVIQERAWRTDLRHPRRWPVAAYSALQSPRLRALERYIGQCVQAVTCVSEEDASALQNLGLATRPTVITNGLDMDAYATFEPLPSQTEPRLVFTGKMDYRPNWDAALWFGHAIFPLIRARVPQAEFVVVGQKPTEAVRQLAQMPGITVTGAVADVRPWIASASVYVAPLRIGGGTRFKLLEAMAMARPVVSTHIGAEGFTLQSGHEMLLADAPADFVEQVLWVLEHPAQAATMAQAGQQFVRERYDWQHIVPHLEQVYARLSRH